MNKQLNDFKFNKAFIDYRICIDTNGNKLFELPNGMKCWEFESEDRATVFKNDKEAQINSKGEIVTKFVEEDDSRYLNPFPESILSKEYDELEKEYDDILAYGNLFAVKKNNKWALYSLNKKKFITDFIYTNSTTNTKDKIIYHNNFSFIDIYGLNVIDVPDESFYKDYFYSYSEGFAVVSKGNKQGMINMKGEIVIPFEYQKLGLYLEGLIKTTRFDNTEGYLNQNNEIVIPFGKYHNCRNFSCGFAVVGDNKESCYINKNDEKLILKV